MNHRHFWYPDFRPDFIFRLPLGGAVQNIFCTQAVFNANRHLHTPLSMPVLDAVSEGPWFFTNLSPGKYTVFATMKEEALSQKVEIKQSGQSVLYFFWAE